MCCFNVNSGFCSYAYRYALQKLVSSLDADEECAEILLQAWYLDSGALAGTRSAVLRALHLIEELSPALGLHVNLAKCSRRGNTSFPPESLLPNLYIIGAPIGYAVLLGSSE